MSQSSWMIYGANGYTGQLLAQFAVEEGESPLLAGRNAGELEALAANLGLRSRVFALDDVDTVAAALVDVDAVVHCAGPFSATSAVMAAACIASGTHYLDITGEIGVLEHLNTLDAAASRAGVTLLPGVGFDVVPTDCLAARLHAALPDANTLELAFCGEGGASPGTLKTMVEMLGDGGRVRSAGAIVKVAAGYRRRSIRFSDGEKRHCMTIPWGDISTAYASTGIANIRVYTAVPPLAGIVTRVSSPLMGMMRWARLQRWLKAQVERRVAGPTAQQRAQGCTRLWGEVSNEAGRRHALWLDIPEGYQFTVISSLRSLQAMLNGKLPTGFQTPSRALGVGFVETLPGCVFRDVRG